jgi:dephospho-CoA kinase
MIIGLAGYAQSGKDTLANVLVENHGYVRIAFADPIRELLYQMDPPLPVGSGAEKHVVGLQNYVDIYGWDVAKQHENVRAMLQNLGVGARTVFGEDFWIQQAIQKTAGEENIVITDVRFINEADHLKVLAKYTGREVQMWRVKRAGVYAVNSHVSESEMDGYKMDQIFSNNGTIEQLESLVHKRIRGM